MTRTSRSSLYRRHRFPPDVIARAVWLYFKFPLSLRMVEDLLAERDIIVSHQTIRIPEPSMSTPPPSTDVSKKIRPYEGILFLSTPRPLPQMAVTTGRALDASCVLVRSIDGMDQKT